MENSNDQTFDITQKDSDYAFLPIRRPTLIKYFHTQLDMFWVLTDIDMSSDPHDWNILSESEDGRKIQQFVKGLLSFFAPADGLICENLSRRFMKDTSFFKEASAFYSIQGAIEMIHSQVYSEMVRVLIRDEEERDIILKGDKNSPSVGKIKNYMAKYMDRGVPLPERILAFVCVEGILFNSAFAGIRWIMRQNILPGFCKGNEFIARDEAIHTMFGLELLRIVCMMNEYSFPTEEKCKEIISEAVNVNKEFIYEKCPSGMSGMTPKKLKQYSRCTADELMEKQLGYSKLYNVENPFEWMTMISLPNKTNYFEDRVSEYAKQSAMDPSKIHFEFDLNVDF